MMRHLKTYKTFEDVAIDNHNIERLKSHFQTKDMSIRLEKISNPEFVKTISNLCLQLDDLDYEVRINFPQYKKLGYETTTPSLCVNVYAQRHIHGIANRGHFINSEVLEMTIREIEDYISDFDLNVDIELGSDDLFVSLEDFINYYNTGDLQRISILIY